MLNVKTVEPPRIVLEPKKHKIQIIKDQFEPNFLQIHKGSTVEWSLQDASFHGKSSSLYHNQKRMHIVSFDAIGEESEPLRSNDDSFKLRFFKEGTFTYRCAIQTRMRGTIEVVDPKPEPKIATFCGNDFFKSKVVKERVGSERRSHISSERASSMIFKSDRSASELSQRLI